MVYEEHDVTLQELLEILKDENFEDAVHVDGVFIVQRKNGTVVPYRIKNGTI